MEGLDNVRSKFNFSKFFHTIPSNNFKSKLFLDLEAPLPRIINSRSLYPFSTEFHLLQIVCFPRPPCIKLWVKDHFEFVYCIFLPGEITAKLYLPMS